MAKEKIIFEKDVPFTTSGTETGFKVKKKLYSGKSDFQRIAAFDLVEYGRSLFLDGIIQTTEADEFIYHEMLCHPPLFLHPKAEKVLILGGGDGGALKEVLKQKNVKEVWMVDIDKQVVEISKKYLPSISRGAFKDKRLKLFFEDARQFVPRYMNFFDVIILDLPDPGGAARNLIVHKFYSDVKSALKKNGITSLQVGSLTIQSKLIHTVYKRLGKIFKFVQLQRACVPSYQSGEYIFAIASDWNFLGVSKNNLNDIFETARLDVKYWSPEMYLASITMPLYLKSRLK